MPGPSTLARAFETHFGRTPEFGVRAPGRVNLIGEHTDYNAGWVLPCAIDRELRVAGSRRPDPVLRVWSRERGGPVERPLETARAARPEPVGDWTDYLVGVAWALARAGHEIPAGLDLAIESDVPAGAGLSSSAALGVAAAWAFERAFRLGLGSEQLARIAHRGESDYVGVGCGIMDPFASALGRADRALLLDCRDQRVRLLPLPGDRVRLLVADSGVRRTLAPSGSPADASRRADPTAATDPTNPTDPTDPTDPAGPARSVASEASADAICPTGPTGSADASGAAPGAGYERRREECAHALAAVRKAGIAPEAETLRDLGEEQLAEVAAKLAPTLARRVRHVVSENARVEAMAAALERGDLEAAGALLRAGQASLRDDFEVSIPELDALCEIGDALPGVFGSRLTGAGFGGCTLHLVASERADEVAERLASASRDRFGRVVRTFLVRAGEGAGPLAP